MLLLGGKEIWFACILSSPAKWGELAPRAGGAAAKIK